MSQSKRVRDFNKQVGEALPALPTMLDRGEDPRTADYFGVKLAGISDAMKSAHAAGNGGMATFRAALVLEEIAELLQATTIEDQVDAIADAKIYLDGTAAFMGIDIDPIESIAMDANEGKIWPDGTIHRDENGKWTKPPGWKENHAPEPKIREEIALQQLEAAIKAGEYIIGVDLARGCTGCGACGACGACEEPSEVEDGPGEPVLYNVWFVPIHDSHWTLRLEAENLTKDAAEEYIWFEHADEPSPDRSNYWNYVARPVGETPKIGERR